MGAFGDELTDELGQGREEDMEHEPSAGVVVSRASCRLLKPTPRRRRSATRVDEVLQGAGDPAVADQGAGQNGGFGREAVDLVRGLHHAPSCAENGRCGLLSTSSS